MEYTGKLYGKIRNKYFDTGFTSEDYDKLQKENSELQKQILNLPVVKHRLCLNCKHCLPNAYAKYHHDRYFCTVNKNNDKMENEITITSPENYNCNRHDFNGATTDGYKISF